MDAENAFNTINDLVPKAVARGDADWILHIRTRLENEQPEVYDAELPYLLMSHLEATAATGRVDELVADRGETLETMAVEGGERSRRERLRADHGLHVRGP